MQKSFEVNGPVRLDVHLSSGPDRDRAHARRTRRGRADGARQRVAAARRRGARRAARQRRPAGGRRRRARQAEVVEPRRPCSARQTISCRIQCPAGSDLKARSKSADIRARGTLGDVDVATASGDVAIVDTLGDVSIKSASGDLSAGSVGGRATANTASGDVTIESVAGPVVANTASGDVEIHSAGSDVRANSASGDTNIGAVVRGSVVVNAASATSHRCPPRLAGSPGLLDGQRRRPLGARARHRRAGRRRPVRRGEGTHGERRHHHHPGARARRNQGGDA